MIMRNDMAERAYGYSEKYRCPFYGFSLFKEQGVLAGGRGNRCALSYTPCQMEIHEDIPDWDECGFNNPNNSSLLEKIADSFMVYPEEFNSGISFDEWMDYIMGER